MSFVGADGDRIESDTTIFCTDPTGPEAEDNVCSASLPLSQAVMLTALPVDRFIAWTGCPDADANVCSFAVPPEGASVQAEFADTAPAQTLQISAISGNDGVESADGTIDCAGRSEGTPTGTCSASYADGASVQLTAVPGEGHEFSSWGGACLEDAPQSGTNPLSLTLSTDKDCTAAFEEVSGPGGAAFLQIFFATPDSGTVISSDGLINCRSGGGSDCGELYVNGLGTTVALEAVPDEGFVLEAWELDCTPFEDAPIIGVTLDQPSTDCRVRFVPE